MVGRAKTWLCPPLTPTEAGALHSALVLDAGNMLITLATLDDTDVEADMLRCLDIRDLEGNTAIWARRYRER
jgi:hypothetical protein